jgi:DNA-binding CsgD family transcriptional regulator
MLGTAAVLTVGDVVVRLLFFGGIAAGSALLKRGQTLRIAVAAAALLVAAFLADQLGWAAAVPALSASAFGVLEPIPWFVVARHAAASTNSKPWAAVGTALFVLRFGIAIPITARIDEHVLVLLGLPGALAALLALMLVPDLLSLEPQAAPPVPTKPGQPEVAAGLAAPTRSVDAGKLLERHYGECLSPRELEIGSLAIAGVSTREIAERLFLTENTVKYHLKNLFRKTGAENRHDLYRKLVAADGNPGHRK